MYRIGDGIPPDDKAAVKWYTSGNRDETVIERPNASNHLSFGFGLHRCVGNRVGELQLRIAWEEILKRFQSVEVVGSPVRLRSHVLGGYTALPAQVKRF